MNKYYSWSFDPDAEIWYEGENTIQGCIAAAREASKELGIYDEEPTVVYIGENMPFEPSVDAEQILDQIEEDAGDFAGELGGDWIAYDAKNQVLLEELSNELSSSVNKWLKKYGHEPNFYAVQNVKEYSLFEEAGK